MAFFRPFVTNVGGKPFICYTDVDVAKRFPRGMAQEDADMLIADFHINWRTGEEVEFVPKDTDFTIGFLWANDTDIFVDVWLNRQLATYGECGPMKTLQSFRHSGEFLDPWQYGNGCDWTNIVTGREAEHRRAIMGRGGTLDDYINGSRPEMPDGFIVPWTRPG